MCDAILTVAVPKALGMEVRKCKNCGGKVGADDTQCPYCQGSLAPWDQAKSTLCPACFVRLEDDSKHCKACGIGIAPQALIPVPADKSCPRCEGELLIRSLEATSALECSACSGMWVRPKDFEAICQRAQKEARVALEPKLESVGAAEPERRVTYIPCIDCSERMLRKMFRYQGLPSRVVVDYCRLHGVWLDESELGRVVAFIREKAAGQRGFDLDASLRPPAPRKREFGGSRRAGSLAPRGGWLEGGWGAFFALEILGELLEALFD